MWFVLRSPGTMDFVRNQYNSTKFNGYFFFRRLGKQWLRRCTSQLFWFIRSTARRGQFIHDTGFSSSISYRRKDLLQVSKRKVGTVPIDIDQPLLKYVTHERSLGPASRTWVCAQHYQRCRWTQATLILKASTSWIANFGWGPGLVTESPLIRPEKPLQRRKTWWVTLQNSPSMICGEDLFYETSSFQIRENTSCRESCQMRNHFSFPLKLTYWQNHETNIICRLERSPWEKRHCCMRPFVGAN